MSINDDLSDVDGDDIGYVNDDYQPYEDPICANPFGEDVDDVNYIQRVFKNGQMYVDQGWENIKLAPWRIFVDKKHLRDVVKDYAIQSGFEYVVDRANNRFYTVKCMDINCNWRLHGSRLADCIAWAIKKN